jgi:hypothetical protein
MACSFADTVALLFIPSETISGFETISVRGILYNVVINIIDNISGSISPSRKMASGNVFAAPAGAFRRDMKVARLFIFHGVFVYHHRAFQPNVQIGNR